MNAISRDSLLSLEAYARQRAAFRSRVIAHKKERTLHLGEHIMLVFEDELTIRYQIQEMLRIERTFEEEGIQDELDAYSPLVPDGSNWKATMMLEFPVEAERRLWLTRLIGIEKHVWVRVAGCEPIFAIADEDLERDNDEKTSAVHFLRFELPPPAIRALHAGAALAIGVDHPAMTAVVEPVPDAIRQSLCGDLRA
ncbi:DUF3501 family protein [Aromatoleum toluvorans]|uniref:DUF3501 family protein n=1 Tax=Aromatoleum toluvorans TaxID=92002 RepID=A0ABX1PYK9_9RHOO|nr:DUF3501 family protein [Aromatoleum toluvorans]NMG44458.1 DUF3501 family protein [Aromatoleum toluvorans]